MINKTLPEEIYPDTSSVSNYNDHDFTKMSISKNERLNVYWNSRVIFGNAVNTTYALPLDEFIDQKIDLFKHIGDEWATFYSQHPPKTKLYKFLHDYLWAGRYWEDTIDIRFIAEVINKTFFIKMVEEQIVAEKLQALESIFGILDDLSDEQNEIFNNEISRKNFF
jgi:hypothetical protein